MINPNKIVKATLIILLFACTVIPSSKLLAQDSAAVRGKNALQFQVGSNFNLSSFSGTTFSYKYAKDKNTIFRFGLSVSGASKTSDQNDQTNFVPGSDSGINKDTVKQDNYNYFFKINADYLVYNNVFNDIAFYYGAGPFISYSTTNSTYDNNPNTEAHTRSEANNTGWEFGINGTCGVDWFFSKNMSLSAEYGLFIYFSTAKNKNTNINTSTITTQEIKSHGFSFGSNPVKLGISFYF